MTHAVLLASVFFAMGLAFTVRSRQKPIDRKSHPFDLQEEEPMSDVPIYLVELRCTCDSTVAFVGLSGDELLGFKRAVATVNNMACCTPTLHIKSAAEINDAEWEQYRALLGHKRAFEAATGKEPK